MVDKRSLDGLALLHDLVPFLPVDRLHALLSGQPLPDRAEGTALFADISGFTTLAEALSDQLGTERGAEELNTQVNYTFVGMIDAVDRYHGSVIRFSGDGLTAWFTGEDHALRGVTAALAMQVVMQAVVAVLPDLQVKIGLGSGPTRRFNPGDVTCGAYDVLAGHAVAQMARAVRLAQPGQIVLSPETGQHVREQFAQIPLEDGFHLLKYTLFAPKSTAPRWTSIRWMDHLDHAWELVEACRSYMPAPIYERLADGHGAYMTELRLVTPLFIHFTGFDYDAPDADRKLDELVRAAQTHIHQHGGYLNEVGVGDKGSELVALFGAPVALENPATRAAFAALTLHEVLPHVEALHIGLTCGRLFTGTVGSPMRRGYAAIGNEVNLAARLMAAARPGETLANYRAHQMGNDFAWEALPAIRVKGKVAPVRVYRLLGLADITRPLWPEGRFVARSKELEALNWAVSTHRDRRARLLLMVGESGLGKSHLLGEFENMLREHGITGLFGAGRHIEQQMPYHVWRDVFAAYFDIAPGASPEEKRGLIIARLEQIAPQLVSQAPLLNDILASGFPENRFTRSLEPAERHSALVSLLIALLRAWLEEDALAIVLDNAQWLDGLSWDLTYQIGRQILDRPLSILISMRPLPDPQPEPLRLLENLENVRQLLLTNLSPEDVRMLAAEHLGVSSLPAAAARLIMEKTGGNPFFIKEVTTVLRESGMLEIADGKAILTGDPTSLELPDTVQGIVRSRIDRLPPDQQTLLKVAAVIGAQFSYRTLRAIQPLRLGEDALRENLAALDSMDVHQVEVTGEDGSFDAIYTFQYAITREVAYHSLSFSQRRQLHRAIARWTEQEYADTLEAHYAPLIHHWRAAEESAKEYHYCILAGARAAAQYANRDAISYLVRAVEIAPAGPPNTLFNTLLQLEDLYHLTASRREQYTVLNTLSGLADQENNPDWQARAATLWARYYESVAQYEDCIAAADQAFAFARQVGAPGLMGLSAVYRGLGLMHLGRAEEAAAALSEVYAAEDNRIEAWRLDVLGVTRARMGDYLGAGEAYLQAQARGNAAGDRAAVSRTLNNLGDNCAAMGDYEQALGYYSRALTIRQTIGDRQGEAVTLNSLGILSLMIGDLEPALHYLMQTRDLFQIIGDRSSEAEAALNIGRLHFEQRDYEIAREYLQTALKLRREIGDRRGAVTALLNLAMADSMLNRLSEAQIWLDEAAELDYPADPTPLQDILGHALTAEIAYKQGAIDTALTHAEAALKAVQRRGLGHTPSALRISLMIYEVLDGCGRDRQAADVLREAHALLQERAGRITDPERRARYLLTVPHHARIAEIYRMMAAPVAG